MSFYAAQGHKYKKLLVTIRLETNCQVNLIYLEKKMKAKVKMFAQNFYCKHA